jgi:hypothetical protein
MDLYSAEYNKLKTIVQSWHEHDEQELEATFGKGGNVDAQTFLTIAQRLRSKGFSVMPQDERLSILQQKQIRFSIQGLGVIQQYCRDDSLIGKNFTAIIKDSVGQERDIFLEEYNVKIKSRREIGMKQNDISVQELLKSWSAINKAFRLIRRWTFLGKGVRFDLSMVRQTKKDSRGQFKWVKKFTSENIFSQPPVYEVEVELLRNEYTDTPEKALKELISGIGEVMRGIQKNNILITNSKTQSVLSEYIALMGIKQFQFRGVSPVTLEAKNMTVEIDTTIPNIRNNYNVTDKADGLRVLAFCDSTGELFMIDMGMNVYRTGMRNEKCANSLLDGEWVTQSVLNKAVNFLLLFDIYYSPDGEDVSQLPFYKHSDKTEEYDSRWKQMRGWMSAWADRREDTIKNISDITRLNLQMKTFRFANLENPNTIFAECSTILNTKQMYHTDGLILTPNLLALPRNPGETFSQQFKWKPAKDNTIDFYVTFQKVENSNIDEVITTVHPSSGETIRYKIMRLFVGSSRNQTFDNPRATILNEIPIDTNIRKKDYKPVLFYPADFPDTMANICYREVSVDPETGEDYVITEMTEDPIRDNSIVEMRYDHTAEPGWRWIPIRIRHDKTERLLKGVITRTLNSEKVANSVWNSIHEPVTPYMIQSGSTEPSEKEIDEYIRAISKQEVGEIGDVYYERKASKEDLGYVRGLRDFHNKYIKDILYSVCLNTSGKTVLDLAVGRAGDLQKWRKGKAKFVLGIDVAGENIVDPNGGAYARYMSSLIEFGKDRLPLMVFCIGNSSRSILHGDAGSTKEEQNILKTIFKRDVVDGIVPKFVQNNADSILQNGVDCAVCMFAIHYFFKDKDILDGFLRNIDETVKEGGYFVGCCFDGQKVFNMLRSRQKGQAKIGSKDNVTIWSITKEYSETEFLDDDSSVGLPIDVEFISIGTVQREYLVSFDYLEKRLREIGFDVLNDEELKSFNLQNSTNTFYNSYKMAQKAGHKYVMDEVVQDFSFLNRWFIFKRKNMINVREEDRDGEEKEEVVDKVEEIIIGDEEDERGEEAERGEAVRKDDKVEKAEGEKEEIVEKKVEFRLPSESAKFKPNEVFYFSASEPTSDKLKINDDGSSRWLSLFAPFPIQDPDNSTIQYPSMEHYLAAMKLKHASTRPEYAETLLSDRGTIHQKYLQQRQLSGWKSDQDPMINADMYKSLKNEADEVRKQMTSSSLKVYKIVIDEGKWVPLADKYLMEGLRQRWLRDARFHKIVEAARQQQKYMLYNVGISAASELGGSRKLDGRIEGENKVGKFIMQLAQFMF